LEKKKYAELELQGSKIRDEVGPLTNKQGAPQKENPQKTGTKKKGVTRNKKMWVAHGHGLKV